MGVIKQYLAGLAAAFGAFCLGASIGWSGPVEFAVLSGQAYKKFTPTSDEWGWVSSLMTLGAACMCVPSGILIKAIGRKITMLCLVLPYLVGWALIIFAQKVIMLFAGRFIVGACGGAFCITAPMYTTEIAQVEIRGMMGCFFQLLIVHGVLYGYVAGAICTTFVFNIACGVLPLLFFVFFVCMPESPVYLAQKGKTEKAEKALKWLRGGDADTSAELGAMVASGNKEKVNIGESLCRKATLKGLFVSMMLMLFQQLTGINAIIFYSTGIFVSAGTGMSGSTCTIVIGVVMVFATILAVLIIEKVGRKILLLVSAILMAITTCIMGCYFQFLLTSNVGILPVISICIFIVGFSVGFGPVPWLLMAEVFAEDIKPIAGSIAGTSNWLFAFCVTKLFPILVEHLGTGPTFWIFTVISVAAVIFIFIFVPETKGKTLDEIQAELGKSKKEAA
ncbi:facilitated trehalose transporter Tret1-2 homolog [Scaptodrosophila lebanonensis]|uniref:Facilitated trehalose transporter Tret1-2 homolog n=1 Tax=Drosophila lebanonensis TaxID=7225 RepID=A0A6J2TT04_DROLE|nr:facilitated trehalose transporter Tret1-2 homolog [Scaptodrosophila lebanonensis]